MTDEADPKGNPIGTELVYEDESVRVWRIELAPGETAGWHTHYLDYTTVGTKTFRNVIVEVKGRRTGA